MDFITDLLQCGEFNGIYTSIDKLTKFVKLIPALIREGALLAPEAACPFFEHIVHFFSIPYVVLHDCDAYFTAHFGAICGNYWVLGLHYLQPTIHSQMGRPNVLIRQ